MRNKKNEEPMGFDELRKKWIAKYKHSSELISKAQVDEMERRLDELSGIYRDESDVKQQLEKLKPKWEAINRQVQGLALLKEKAVDTVFDVVRPLLEERLSTPKSIGELFGDPSYSYISSVLDLMSGNFAEPASPLEERIFSVYKDAFENAGMTIKYEEKIVLETSVGGVKERKTTKKQKL